MLARLLTYHIPRQRFLLLALVATFVFYIQALRNGAADAGFLYTGDVLGYYLPALGKVKSLLSNFHFVAIDFSSYNGSSDFFLTPNLFAVHPLIVAFAILTPASWTGAAKLDFALTAMLAINSFIACYSAHRLADRFFRLGYWPSALVGTTFAFGLYTTNALGQPVFLFSISSLAWSAYAALSFAVSPTIRRLLLGMLPIIWAVLGGYAPLGFAALMMSVILVAVQIFCFQDTSASFERGLRTFLLALAPYACAAFVTGPYLFAVLEFNRETISKSSGGLFFSALQLAEAPQSVLRLLSTNLTVPGSFYEFSVSWGLGALAIVIIFLASTRTVTAISKPHLKLTYVSCIVYFFVVLSIYGDFSPVSNLVYHLIPIVGWSHIYQRYLLPGNIFFGLILAVMLTSVIAIRPAVATRVVMAALAAIMVICAILVGRFPTETAAIGINNYVVFELLLSVLICIALAFPGYTFAFCSVIVLLFLPSLGRMYTITQRDNTYEVQKSRTPMSLNPDEQRKFTEHLRKTFNKDLLKYVDVTPAWTRSGVETFPKSYPYFVLDQITLSSYTGFSFYLAARGDYVRRMPVVGEAIRLEPDWNLALRQSADFAIALRAQVERGELDPIIPTAALAAAYPLPNGAVAIPLRPSEPPDPVVVFDNGYFRVRAGQSKQAASALPNIALQKPAHQAGEGNAQLAVDGNTNGDYSRGSVTHTARDPHAWLEVDLGDSMPVGRVSIWNRTDCCGQRLRDYYLLLSETPFLPNEPASSAAARAGVWSRRILSPPNPSTTVRVGSTRARYVRVQLAGNADADNQYLSLAELQVFGPDLDQEAAAPDPASVRVLSFKTNGANRINLVVEAAQPAAVEYLLTPNPRQRAFVNESLVEPAIREDLLTFEIPTGRTTIELIYTHHLLTTFWVVYAAYGAALAAAFVLLVLPRSRPAFSTDRHRT